MRRDQKRYIRALRLQLGNAIRVADDVIEPLKRGLEGGYRWEAEDAMDANIAAFDLRKVATAVDAKLRGMLTQYGTSLSTGERQRLEAARRGLGAGVRFLKEASDEEKLLELMAAWYEGKQTSVTKGHEAYFLTRYHAGLKLLRGAWNKMFYATEAPAPRKIRLTADETRAFRNEMSDVRRAVVKQAEELAEETSRYVQVLDDKGDLLLERQPPKEFVLGQSEALVERGRKAKRGDWSYKPGSKPGSVIRLAEASTEEALAVQELMAERPGMGLREAAAEIGVEVVDYPVQPMNANADDQVERARDLAMHQFLWGLDLD